MFEGGWRRMRFLGVNSVVGRGGGVARVIGGEVGDSSPFFFFHAVDLEISNDLLLL
jgi:hypothetical protein